MSTDPAVAILNAGLPQTVMYIAYAFIGLGIAGLMARNYISSYLTSAKSEPSAAASVDVKSLIAVGEEIVEQLDGIRSVMNRYVNHMEKEEAYRRGAEDERRRQEALQHRLPLDK